MCILFIYNDSFANEQSYKIILASNRDEFYKRPAMAAHYWEKHSDCLGGIDMEPGKEGGTWLALSLKGKVGVTLNLTNENRHTNTTPIGRGNLITNYITSNDPPSTYLNNLHQENQNGQPYNPYNLVLLDLYKGSVHYLNSSVNSSGPLLCKDKILGFGNSYLESPYKKVEVGSQIFKRVIQNQNISNQDVLIENLLQLLKSKESHLPDPELEKRCPIMTNELSSIFVSTLEYGSRTHSILLVDGANRLTFVEETRLPDSTWKRQYFNTKLI